MTIEEILRTRAEAVYPEFAATAHNIFKDDHPGEIKQTITNYFSGRSATYIQAALDFSILHLQAAQKLIAIIKDKITSFAPDTSIKLHLGTAVTKATFNNGIIIVGRGYINETRFTITVDVPLLDRRSVTMPQNANDVTDMISWQLTSNVVINIDGIKQRVSYKELYNVFKKFI